MYVGRPLPLRCEGILLLDMARILGHAAKYSFPYLRGDTSTVQVVDMNHLLVDLDVSAPTGPTPQVHKSTFKSQAQNRYYEAQSYEEYEELIFGPRIPQGIQGGLGVGLSLECNPEWSPVFSEDVVAANFYCEADLQLLDTSNGVRCEVAIVGSSQLTLRCFA